jgi:hypothetical protein
MFYRCLFSRIRGKHVLLDACEGRNEKQTDYVTVLHVMNLT